jgi:hypothetical protein
VLRKLGNPDITPTYFRQFLEMSLLEFERDARPATVSRALMIKTQRCGDLPGLYRDVRAQAQQINLQEEAERIGWDELPRERVEAWLEMLTRRGCK